MSKPSPLAPPPSIDFVRDDEIFLLPGQWHFATRPAQIRTVLGSCVSIVLWHPARRIGGMCHYLLSRPRAGVTIDTKDAGRYGDTAWALLKREVEHNGSPLREYVAKVFGGGRMFEGTGASSAIPDANVARAFELLAADGMPVAARHVGGAGSRSLSFDVDSGEIRMRFTGVPQ